MGEDFALPSTALMKLWREWIDLHTVLDKGMPRESTAGPFFSAASSQKSQNRILMVGKATGDPWWLGDYRKQLRKSPEEAIRFMLRKNREVVETGGNRSAFWKLFKRLAELFPEPDSRNMIWSNVAKIGSLKGNPEGVLFSAQKDLAERTLRQEVNEYRPVLVVFTTGSYSYSGDVINRALNLTDSDWTQSKKRDADSELFWREGPPAMLGTRHPQGVSMDKIDFWMKRASMLVGR